MYCRVFVHMKLLYFRVVSVAVMQFKTLPSNLLTQHTQLEIDACTVQHSLVTAPKLKLKPKV